jgi:hypothetical protein
MIGMLRKFLATFPNGLSGVMQILACTILSKVNGSNKATANNMLMGRVDFSSNFVISWYIIYRMQIRLSI